MPVPGIIQPMDLEKPSFRPFIFPTIFLIIAGWSGLIAVMLLNLPFLWPRWAFFALVVMAFTGTALPISFLWNQRFLSNRAAVVARQAIWVGLYAAILVWLSIGRILNFSVALWFILGFIGLEFLLLLRERPTRSRMQREPSPPPEPSPDSDSDPDLAPEPDPEPHADSPDEKAADSE